MRGAAVGAACAYAIVIAGCDPGLPEIGSPCIPAVESDPTFDGFDPAELSPELPFPNADPGERVCLVNHFRGRVTCPYGQDATGTKLPSGAAFPPGAHPCTTPPTPVVGAVPAQCTDRPAVDDVIWSCRCANADGKTDDGRRYCSCPSGMRCTAPVSLIVQSLSDAYCVKSGTEYVFPSCLTSCDPSTATCL